MTVVTWWLCSAATYEPSVCTTPWSAAPPRSARGPAREPRQVSSSGKLMTTSTPAQVARATPTRPLGKRSVWPERHDRWIQLEPQLFAWPGAQVTLHREHLGPARQLHHIFVGFAQI